MPALPVKVLLISGILEIHIQYTLEPLENAVHVNRDVTIHLPAMLRLAQPIVTSTVRRESKRLLQTLKRSIETPM